MNKPQLLILDDNAEFAHSLKRGLASRFSVRLSEDVSGAKECLERGVDVAIVDVVLDPKDPSDRSGLEFVAWASQNFPETAAIVLTGHGEDELEVEALRVGAADYVEKEVGKLKLLRAKIEALLERQALRNRSAILESRLEEYEPHVLVGDSPAIRKLRAQIRRLAQTDSIAFIQGESGVGKEVVARALHHASPRRDGPFVAVNCAALSAGLLESELFGHERGAFTGADRRRVGCFESAEHGTLLLDEITEIDVGLQAKLLRVLQNRQIQRVGSSRMIEVDTRVLATTNRDAEEAVQQGVLRHDLFYRLNVLPLDVPPLRQHLEDLPVLIDHFLERVRRRIARPAERFSSDAIALLEVYHWPGNVRELQNVVERAFVLSEDEVIEADLLQPWLAEAAPRDPVVSTETTAIEDLNLDRAAAIARLQAISEALRRSGGVKNEAQDLLGFRNRSTMRRTVQRLRRQHPDLWSRYPILEREYGRYGEKE